MRYRLQRHDGTDCSATMVPITVLRMVPIQRYRQVGDICYLYLIGKGHYQIRFRLEVVDISCAREDNSCWITPFKADNDCYKLIPTAAMYMGDELLLDALEEIGINHHPQFKELNEYQDDYLRKYFE